MKSYVRLFLGVVATLALFVSVAAQQPAAPAGPTPKNPSRFRAVLQSQGQDTGLMGVVDISIERLVTCTLNASRWWTYWQARR